MGRVGALSVRLRRGPRLGPAVAGDGDGDCAAFADRIKPCCYTPWDGDVCATEQANSAACEADGIEDVHGVWCPPATDEEGGDRLAPAPGPATPPPPAATARARTRTWGRGPEGKIHRVDPDFGSTLTVSNRDYQSNWWVNWKIMGQPCEFQVQAACLAAFALPGLGVASPKR
jgi:hypothetical protein